MLLAIDLAGRAHVLPRLDVATPAWAAPSPDGHRVTLAGTSQFGLQEMLISSFRITGEVLIGEERHANSIGS